jgi:acyl transferase domain-containing protein
MDVSNLFETEIAVIGMEARFPGARNPEEFWGNLCAGVESITVFVDGNSTDTDGRYVPARGMLTDIELFDASFFGFSPREAEVTDPQHRLFLECAWTALENAGYDPGRHGGLIGVYAGASTNSYLPVLRQMQDLVDEVGKFQIGIGNNKDYLCTHVSYKLNLKGPSITVATACSTSLLAVHLACQSLLNGECDMALAGGISVVVPQRRGYFYNEGGILSPDGHCRAFDAGAQGTVPGSGVGIVVLKRLKDALTDGDFIHGVIKGSAINNDGSLKVSYTAPSVDGQSEVIAAAQAMAGTTPDTISYIEAHGTGTLLGDPIEIAALNQVFRAQTDKIGFCAIGSVKTNVGHLDVAAGVAGLIKVVLALKHKLIPPTLHFKQANPQINFANSPFFVNTELLDWGTRETPRRAGVSSFGIGGTNAHVVLEEAPEMENSGPSRGWQLLVLSAKTNKALDVATQNLVSHFRRYPDLNLADVAYTLQLGRRVFDHRCVVVCQNSNHAVAAVEARDSQFVRTGVWDGQERRIVFAFPGQGTQYVDMGKELYDTEVMFREEVNRCAELLRPHLRFDIREVIYPNEERLPQAAQELKKTEIAQPALFVLEYALAKLWMSWGVRPQAMIGHSIGEYVAACLAGVMSLSDALRVVAIRGRLMQALPSGSMISVACVEDEIRPLIRPNLALAAVNSPSQCVVSGVNDAVLALETLLAAKGVPCRRLHTSHAFHSAMMEPIIEPFMEVFRGVPLETPKIPYMSNVTGTWIKPEEALDPYYWAQHLLKTVRFSDEITELLQESACVLLEVGPGRTLGTLVQQHKTYCAEPIVVNSLRHREEPIFDVRTLLTTIGRLWLAGVTVDWSAFYGSERRHRLPLPTYPFERERYWIQPRKLPANNGTGDKRLGKRLDLLDWFYVPSWKRSVTPSISQPERSLDQELRWLVFVDDLGLGAQIERRLKENGHNVVGVKMGTKFSKITDALYYIRPQVRKDYDLLIKELGMQKKTPNRIVHLWSVTQDHPRQLVEPRSFESLQDGGFYSLLFLAQALAEQQVTEAIRIEVISNHVQEVDGEVLLCPEKATVLGPCKVIPQEYPNVSCRSIDINAAFAELSDSERNILINQVMAEITSTPSSLVVAYRGRHRWVQIFEPVRLEEIANEASFLREGGIYLITGGLGGIGLVLAQYLARTVKAKLILTGRTPLPPREQWTSWLESHDEQNDISRTIRKVQSLEVGDAQVLTFNADVANFEEMHVVIKQAVQRFGTIHGVIHCAGIAGDGIIPLKTPEVAAAVLAPKVKGTIVLNALLKDIRPDFLALCSSIASILPPPGQIDYSAANAFLDAFAHSSNSTDGTFVVSINWGTWQEVGMALNTKVPLVMRKSREEALQIGIRSDEGADAFGRILCCRLPQVIVSPRDLKARFNKNIIVSESLPPEAKPSKTSVSLLHPRPNVSTQYVAPQNEMQETIAGIWRQLLGINQVGVHDNFFELGGHSLLGMQLMSRVREAFTVDLPLQALFEKPTVAGLAASVQTILWLVRNQEPQSKIALSDREELEL